MSLNGDKSDSTAPTITPTTGAPKHPWLPPQIFSIEHKDKIHSGSTAILFENTHGSCGAASLAS